MEPLREVAHSGQFIGTDKARTVGRKQLELDFERMPPNQFVQPDAALAVTQFSPTAAWHLYVNASESPE
ncbi:MAG: hypothetical protein ABSF22_06410 [Bryobacteraceae bacterium]|jgi:hypothetical protein